MIKKIRKFEGLNELPVYVEDNSELSPVYFNITQLPKTLHAGKNLIRLKGVPDALKVGSAVSIEILDFNGQPIYWEVSKFLYEDNSRILSVWIYEDTPPGQAILTIMGEIERGPNGEEIPDEFKNGPNVRWKTKLQIDSTKRNDSEIIFDPILEPKIKIEEKVRPYLLRDYSGGQGAQFVTQSIGVIDYELIGETPTIKLRGESFKREHVGATVKITPNNATPELNINVDDSTYFSRIDSVQTTGSAVLTRKYSLQANDSTQTYTPRTLTSCSYEIHYDEQPQLTATQNLSSKALFSVNQIEPITGEVYRAKTFIRSRGSAAAWELVDDTVLKESDFLDILVDTGSIDVKTRLGNIKSQDIIDKYWKSELMTRKVGDRIIDPPTFVSNQVLTYDIGSKLFDSMYISSNTTTTSPEQFIKVYPSGSAGYFKKDFEKNGQYDLVFNAYGKTSSTLGSNRKPFIEFYMSGSAFTPGGTFGTSNNPELNGLGKRIGYLDIDELYPGTTGTTFRFDDKRFTIEANNDGQGVLIIKVNAGEWNLADIVLTPSFDNGFNPCQTKTLVSVPSEQVNDELDFKIEYYDYQGQQSKLVSYCADCKFEGGNTYIGGEKNLLTGSLFVGDGTGSGVDITGIEGGLVRSIGYTGFDNATNLTGAPGFALWSGSFLKYGSGEDYNGVGLELHAGGSSGSLLFRTHPTPRFEVITPSFFFGSGSNFISGSNGNLVMSADTFFLGNTDNFLSGSNGNIEISGSNVTVNTPTFFLGDTTTFVSGSNGNISISGSNIDISTPTFFLGSPSSQFISGSNGNMEISSSNFHLTPDSLIVSGSGVQLIANSFELGEPIPERLYTTQLNSAYKQYYKIDKSSLGYWDSNQAAWSVAVWINVDQVGQQLANGHIGRFMDNAAALDDTNDRQWRIAFGDIAGYIIASVGTANIYWPSGSGGANASSGPTPTIGSLNFERSLQGQWYFCVMTHDGPAPGNFRLSVNGETFHTAAIGSTGWNATNLNAYVGRSVSGDSVTGTTSGLNIFGVRYNDGRYEDIAFWNRELSQAEVTTLWNNGSGLDYDDVPAGILSGMEHWYPMDKTGDIQDIHGSGPDLEENYDPLTGKPISLGISHHQKATSYISGSNGRMEIGAKEFQLGNPNGSIIRSDIEGNFALITPKVQITSAGNFRALNAMLQGWVQADYVFARLQAINSSATNNYTRSQHYYLDYQYGGKNYSMMVLTGQLGGSVMQSVRVIGAPNYPIGCIVAGRGTNLSGEQHSITLEIAGSNIYFARRVSPFGNAFEYGFYSDTDDLHHNLFKSVTYGGTTVDAMTPTSGQRWQFVKSSFDWRPVGWSSWNFGGTGKVNLYDGFTTSDSVGINTTSITAGTELTVNGNTDIIGTLTKSAGAFKIPHPDPNKEGYLYHSFVETNTAGDNIYRWEINIENGYGEIELPDYYHHLNDVNSQAWVNAKEHFGKAYGKVDVDTNILKVYADTDGEYNVLLIGTRIDKVATDYWIGGAERPN
jgi:hypothetical protein